MLFSVSYFAAELSADLTPALPCPALKVTTAGRGRPSESKVLVFSHVKTQFSLSTVHSCNLTVSKENETAGLVWY